MHIKNKKVDSYGFTLIEVIVVITIIGLLSAVVYGGFSEVRQEARDNARMASLKELQFALHLYKAQYGRYPEQGCVAGNSWSGPGPHSAAWGNDDHCEEYIVGLVPDFISSLPVDPMFEMEDNRGYLYRTDATGSYYKVLAHDVVEALNPALGDEFARCSGNCGTNSCSEVLQPTVYAVYSKGAQCL